MNDQMAEIWHSFRAIGRLYPVIGCLAAWLCEISTKPTPIIARITFFLFMPLGIWAFQLMLYLLPAAFLEGENRRKHRRFASWIALCMATALCFAKLIKRANFYD